MATVSPDIQLRLSGGASNTNPLMSLGGVMSSTHAAESLFDNVTATEASNGRVEYRIIYVFNNRATTLKNGVAWLPANTPSANTDLNIGLGAAALNANEPAIASEGVTPSGVTYSAAATHASGIALGDIPSGQKRSIVLRRTVTAGAPALAADTATVRIDGDYEE